VNKRAYVTLQNTARWIQTQYLQSLSFSGFHIVSAFSENFKNIKYFQLFPRLEKLFPFLCQTISEFEKQRLFEAARRRKIFGIMKLKLHVTFYACFRTHLGAATSFRHVYFILTCKLAF